MPQGNGFDRYFEAPPKSTTLSIQACPPSLTSILLARNSLPAQFSDTTYVPLIRYSIAK